MMARTEGEPRPAYVSRLKQLWIDGRPAIGGWLNLGSPFAAEIAAAARPDYLVIDCQHGLVSHDTMIATLAVIGRMQPVPLVRVAANEHSLIAQALDAGAEGVIVPMVNSVAEAEHAVAACRYPTEGARSFGPIRSRRQLGHNTERMNDGVLCFVMIETSAGLAVVEEICAVPGVDGVYAGPADLALALGQPPRSTSDSPVLLIALERIRQACVNAGIVPGIHAVDGAQAAHLVASGFAMVTAIADTDAVRQGFASELSAALLTQS
jgi:4-hydroxy-2-oxoheptanedioate aldolase